MSDIKISLETSQLPDVDGEITTIRVDGVIDTMTASELEKVTNSLIEQNRYKIIVDLGGVDYISSAGWGIFISNIREIRLNDGDIKLARMIPNVYEIFELLEFDSILKAFDNIAKAKNDFAKILSGTEVQSSVNEETKVSVAEGIAVEAGDAELAQKPSISMGDAVSTKESHVKPNPDMAVDKSSDKAVIPTIGEPKISSGKKRNLKQAILDIIGKDPFLSVGEIRKALTKEFPGTGYLKTWWMLKKQGLGSKKKRFYFARTRRFSK